MTGKSKKNGTHKKIEKEETENNMNISDAQVADPVAAEASPSLEEQLKRQLEETQERLMRARAEMDNLRKRMQRETVENRFYTKSSTIQEFFSVLDHFQMAMDHVEQNPDFETMKQGMAMILNEFRRAFENLGVVAVDATGMEFDPAEHEAVAQEPSATVPKGRVLRQWKCGYRIGDKLLRPASVIVSSGYDDKQD